MLLRGITHDPWVSRGRQKSSLAFRPSRIAGAKAQAPRGVSRFALRILRRLPPLLLYEHYWRKAKPTKCQTQGLDPIKPAHYSRQVCTRHSISRRPLEFCGSSGGRTSRSGYRSTRAFGTGRSVEYAGVWARGKTG